MLCFDSQSFVRWQRKILCYWMACVSPSLIRYCIALTALPRCCRIHARIGVHCAFYVEGVLSSSYHFPYFLRGTFGHCLGVRLLQSTHRKSGGGQCQLKFRSSKWLVRWHLLSRITPKVSQFHCAKMVVGGRMKCGQKYGEHRAQLVTCVMVIHFSKLYSTDLSCGEAVDRLQYRSWGTALGHPT